MNVKSVTLEDPIMKNPHIAKIKDITKSYRDAKKKMITEAKAVFTDLTKGVFQEYSEMESFGWT